ncbi:hypothetical protein [Cupriavidus sp. CuC1]|uniref:hypothetical protein n=1 Tax=Cupriavidus sp. CuC1 TaxID=3373131 RepID=UPI0037CF1268
MAWNDAQLELIVSKSSKKVAVPSTKQSSKQPPVSDDPQLLATKAQREAKPARGRQEIAGHGVAGGGPLSVFDGRHLTDTLCWDRGPSHHQKGNIDALLQPRLDRDAWRTAISGHLCWVRDPDTNDLGLELHLLCGTPRTFQAGDVEHSFKPRVWRLPCT